MVKSRGKRGDTHGERGGSSPRKIGNAPRKFSSVAVILPEIRVSENLREKERGKKLPLPSFETPSYEDTFGLLFFFFFEREAIS